LIRHILWKILPQYCLVSLSPFAPSTSSGRTESKCSARTARKFSFQCPYNYGLISNWTFLSTSIVFNVQKGRGPSPVFKPGGASFMSKKEISTQSRRGRSAASPQPNKKMSHAEIAEATESAISLQSGDTDWRKRLLFFEFSVSSSEAGVRS
jgi:hypothetical protein